MRKACLISAKRAFSFRDCSHYWGIPNTTADQVCFLRLHTPAQQQERRRLPLPACPFRCHVWFSTSWLFWFLRPKSHIHPLSAVIRLDVHWCTFNSPGAQQCTLSGGNISRTTCFSWQNESPRHQFYKNTRTAEGNCFKRVILTWDLLVVHQDGSDSLPAHVGCQSWAATSEYTAGSSAGMTAWTELHKSVNVCKANTKE